jgi:ABC-type antimicrobial peptide transport system permease subunit
VTGLAASALGILVMVRLLCDLLYDVPPFDPIAVGGAVVILVAAVAIALLIPVRRATRVDPILALRAE